MLARCEMTYQTIHTKKDGKKYVYSVEGYWDKEKKAPRNKQICLGRLNEETGEIIPSKRKERTAKRAARAPEVTATAKIIGPALLLNKVATDTGLARVLKKSMPEYQSWLLSLAFFLVQKGLPLSRCEAWSHSNMHPYGDAIASQRVSELLLAINKNVQQTFFKAWMKELAEKECFFYDLTSVSSYSELNDYVRWGHNRDNEKMPQINIAMLFGQGSGLPAYFRCLPGSITDVTTLKTTIASLDFIEQKRLSLILDRGFYSESNTDALFDARIGFILACPRRKWVEELFDEHREHIIARKNRIVIGDGEPLYAETILWKWKARRCYVHIYFNHHKHAEELDAFDYKLLVWQKELEENREKPENKWAYEKYFIVRETPVRGRRVTENEEAIEKAKKRYAGFFCLMTSKKMDATTALRVYRNKEAVENCFDDLKNQLDMKRLRIQSSEAMDARLFIQFVALVLLSRIRQIARQSDALKRLTVREIMEAMEPLQEIRYSGRYGKIVTELDPIQRSILGAFDINSDTLLH